MISKIILFFFIFSFNVNKTTDSVVFSAESVSGIDGYFSTKISLIDNNKITGYIFFFRFCSIYILYNFFVFPEFRNKGYGKKIIEYTLDLLKKNGALKIYIQPGPFEINKEGVYYEIPDGLEREQKIINLLKLYCSYGFVKVSKWMAKFATVFYHLIYYLNLSDAIENSDYLLVLSPNDSNS